jgi:hypothetical protein
MSNPGTTPSSGSRLVAILLCLPAARLLFHLINHPDVPPDLAMAIGIPTAAAFAVALLAPSPRSATGRLLKGMTVLLLVAWGLFTLSGTLVLTISPLLFSTTMIVGLALDTAHRTAAVAPLLKVDPTRAANPSRRTPQ